MGGSAVATAEQATNIAGENACRSINADDGCPINVEVEGRDDAPVADAVEFARHQPAHVGRPGGRIRQALPPGPLRPPRPRQIRRAEGPLHDGALGRDVLAVLDALGVKKTNWCGLSMGGMVGQWLGANAPDRVEKLVLSNTNYLLRRQGAVERPHQVRARARAWRHWSSRNMERWFTKGFRERAPQAIARMTRDVRRHQARRLHRPACEAVRDMDFRAIKPTIKAPTLVIVGKQDPATPPAHGEAIAKAIPGAKLVALDAAHISNIEQPQAYTKAVLDFLTANRGARHGRTRTLRTRHGAAPQGAGQCLGRPRQREEERLQREEFQDFITRAAWGEVWTRPHFDERTRRILVIGTMLALGKWEEFRMHVRAALTEGGFSRRRHQGDHPAAGDLLRRAGGQPRLQGSGRGDRRDRQEQIAETSGPLELSSARTTSSSCSTSTL